MFHLAGTVLNNTRLEQVYLYTVYIIIVFIRYSAGNSLLTVLNDWKIRAKLSINNNSVYIYIYIYYIY